MYVARVTELLEAILAQLSAINDALETANETLETIAENTTPNET
jgi:hypothetical protein